MAASRIPPELFEMILQFAPDNGYIGFKVDKHELQEDSKITIRKNQFGPISIRSPNQLRLLNRIALAYVSRWKSSKLRCEIWMRSDQEDFSKAEVALSFLHSNAVPLIGRIIRQMDKTKLRMWHDYGKRLERRYPDRFAKTVDPPAEGAFKGLPDLASSYYSDQIAQIELHVHISESSVHLAEFCRWFHCFWLYVLEMIPSAADLPTFVGLTCCWSLLRGKSSAPFFEDENLSERGVFQEMPNNFLRLDFSQFHEAWGYDIRHANLPEPLLSGSVDFIFNAGRGTIKHVAGSLPDILSLGFRAGAAAASIAFPAVKQIDATFTEGFRFVGSVNPFAQIVSLFPSLECVNLYARRSGNPQAITMDLSPLLQAPNFGNFQFGGSHVGWTDCYVQHFANDPLSRWNIQHPGIRSIRLASAQTQNSDDMPAEQIVALRKLLNLNAASYDCLELIHMFSVKQFLAIFDAYTIFPKVACLRRLSIDIDYTTERDPEELLDSIVRLFARIERTMPHLCALSFGVTKINIDRLAPDPGAFEFARSPEIALLWRFVANRPKQLKELTLSGILKGPDESVPGNDEQWLLCTLRCLIESNLSCLVVMETRSGVDWPQSSFQRWNANPGSIKDLFKSLPPAATKGKRLQSVKFYTRKREVEFPFSLVAESMRDRRQAVELRCVLASASTGETQTLRMRAAARIVS